jgi:hypothetical protein
VPGQPGPVAAGALHADLDQVAMAAHPRHSHPVTGQGGRELPGAELDERFALGLVGDLIGDLIDDLVGLCLTWRSRTASEAFRSILE